MSEILKATTFKDSNLSFQAALMEHGVEFGRRIQLPEAVMASGFTIEIIITGGLILPLFDVPLSHSIMRPSPAVPRPSFSQTALG